MKRLAVLAALLLLASLAYGQPGKGYRDDRGYSGRGYVTGYISGDSFQDVDLETLGQDLIAGVNWTPDVDFSDGDKYYFDPTIVPVGAVGSETNRGDGSIDDPFFGLGYELYANIVIEQWDETGTLTNGGTAVVGVDDVCVLRGGNHGKIDINEMRFADYVGIVGMPGERVLFDYISIRVGAYFFIEGLEANPENTRNSGYWPPAQEHAPNDYADHGDGPWFVYIGRDTLASNHTSHHIVVKDCKLGVSSGDIPSTWDHEDWNNNTVSGARSVRTPYVQIQGCYGVGMGTCLNVKNDFIDTGGSAEPTTTVNCNNIFNNSFQYMNGDGIYVHHAQYTEVKGNTWVETYCTNDDHVVMIDTYDEAANNIYDGNKIVVSTTSRPSEMADYTANCVDTPDCEGHGGGGINLIGSNTNNIVRNNVVHGNEYKLINIRSLYGSSYNVKVTNNTLTCDAVELEWESSGSKAQIGTQISLAVDYPGYPTGDTLQVEINNNICSEILIDLPEDIWSTEHNNSEYDVDFTGAGFTYWQPEGDPTEQDVSLALGSENINTGTSRNSPPTDYAGTCRAYGGFADIGAYEYDDGGDCEALLRRMVLLPVASVDHLIDAADADIAAADDLLELGTGKDVPEFAWVSIDSTTAPTSSAWLGYSGRWEKERLLTTKDDWNITDEAYPMLGLYYVDWEKHIPIGATILSAEMHVTVEGTWYVSANDSISATLMTNPDDNLWYTSRGVDLSSDAAPNMAHSNWSYQIAGLNSNGYPATAGGDWSPSLADRQAFDDWGDVSDWSGFPGAVNKTEGEEYAIDIKNCVQAAVDGMVNNGIMLSAKKHGGAIAFNYYSMEPRPTTGPHNKVPWFTVTYSTTGYQTPFPGGEFAFVFTTDDGKIAANETYADVFDEFGWKYSAFVAKTHFNGAADEPTAESITELVDRGFEVGSHSRHHLSPYGIAQWDLQAGRTGAQWDSLLRDVEPDWMYHLADSLDGDSRESSEYFGKSFATPQNQLDQEAVFALANKGYNGVRLGLERKASATGLSDYFREMTFRASISDSMRIMGIPGDMLREQNMMGVPFNIAIQDVVGEKTNTTITEAEVKWNFRRLIRQVVAQKTKVVSLYVHNFKSGGYAEGLDEEELRWLLEVVEDEGGTCMMLTDYVNWKKQFSIACDTPKAYAQTDSMDFNAADAVWYKPTAETRLYPYEDE